MAVLNLETISLFAFLVVLVVGGVFLIYLVLRPKDKTKKKLVTPRPVTKKPTPTEPEDDNDFRVISSNSKKPE